jgi:hypothetical protein
MLFNFYDVENRTQNHYERVELKAPRNALAYAKDCAELWGHKVFGYLVGEREPVLWATPDRKGKYHG